jgi:hypothetical protein
MLGEVMSRENLAERVDFYNRLIEPVYQRTFPKGFKLKPLDWILDSEIVNRDNVEIERNGELINIRPIGTLDLEILSNDIVLRARRKEVDLVKNYPCGLKCPGCFSEESIFSESQYLLLWEQVMSIVDVARTIGLHSVKFLGPGELFQNPDLFAILDAFHARKMPISIFTKGSELGDDEHARRNFSHCGINSAKELVARVSSYDNVRILLGFNSFFTSRQDSMVGSNLLSTTYRLNEGIFSTRGVSRYTEKRNQALKNLVDAGFNDPARGQRLSLIMAPVLKNQIDEVAEVYEWAARRNIPLIVTPSMESGFKAQALVDKVRKIDKSNEWIKDIFKAIYERTFFIGIMTFDDVLRDGLSAYIGTEGCNQVANGLMVRLNGQVKICPGSSISQHIYGKLYNENGVFDPAKIIDIWINSPNYRMSASMNNWCPAKQTMLPHSLPQEVLSILNLEGRRLEKQTNIA